MMENLNERGTLIRQHPEQVVARAEEIYARKYKREYEQKYRGKFAIIDITTEKAYVGVISGDVLSEALRDSPRGVFHLIRIGHRAAHQFRRYGR